MHANFLSSVDSILVSAEFIADPYPTLDRLRSEAPVYWSEAIGGWILTRYDDIIATFKDTASYSNENRLGRAVEYLPPAKRVGFKPFEDHYAIKSLLHSDPPDHTRLRSLVTREFTPAVVEQMRPRIQEAVNHLLDAVQKKGKMEVVGELASPLPVRIITEILGVPPSDRQLIKRWTDDLLAFQGVNKPSEADLSRAQRALLEMRPYIEQLIKERRRSPRADLISKFASANTAEEQFSDAELINTCVTLFVAGHETTVSLIGNTVHALLANHKQLELLKQTPDLLVRAIEESLRFESPVSRQTRYMKANASLGGKHLRKGDMVFQMLNAANRDPACFEEPNRFDITREKNRHIAFGFGAHFCVGATLARTEGAIAVGTLIRRLSNLRLIQEQADWDLEKRNSRVLKSIEVCF